MIIAIDGPAGAGKSSVARIIAKKLKFLYIDTGAMYRALTLKALEEGVNFGDAAALAEMSGRTQIQLRNGPNGSLEVFLDGRDVTSQIRRPQITRFVSDVAKIEEVRRVMLKLQRGLGREGNLVLDGRDIGTVVFPGADKKFYIDADFKERVRRRHKELLVNESRITSREVEADLANRDKIDSTRECAPLKKAPDAIYIDTTRMTIQEVVDRVLEEINL